MSSASIPKKKPQIESIQSARAIAALLVVLYHLAARFEPEYLKSSTYSLFLGFGYAGVDLFFVISGFIMVVTSYSKLGQPSEAIDFLWRRCIRIYPLYWIVTTLHLGLLLLASSNTEREFSPQEIIFSYLLIPQSIYPILAPGWTLVHEMFFYLGFSLLFFIPRKWLWQFLLAWGVITIAFYPSVDSLSMTDTTDMLQLPIYGSTTTLEFLAGCCLGLLYIHKITRFANLALILGIASFFYASRLIEGYLEWSPEFGFARVLSFGLPSALILYGWVSRESNNKITINCWPLRWIGDASYSIYLTHMMVQHACGILWKRFATENLAAEFMYRWFVVAACVISGILLYHTVERPLLHLLKHKKVSGAV